MKTKEEIVNMMNANPRFHMATIENGKPRVRGLLLYKADERGIIFHTGKFKDLHRQLQANPEVEMCFFDGQTGEQLRVSGSLVEDTNAELINEIYNHPTRAFLRAWGDSMSEKLAVYRMPHGRAHLWTMSTNFDAKQYVDI